MGQYPSDIFGFEIFRRHPDATHGVEHTWSGPAATFPQTHTRRYVISSAPEARDGVACS